MCIFLKTESTNFPFSPLLIIGPESSNARGLCLQTLTQPLFQSLPLLSLPSLYFLFISFRVFTEVMTFLFVLPNLVSRMVARTVPQNNQTPFIISHYSRSSIYYHSNIISSISERPSGSEGQEISLFILQISKTCHHVSKVMLF
jgi:hypothetical protein